MWKDFKAFAMRGNVVDLAVAVVIGGAFGRIVTSLVSDLIMPLLSLILGGVSFSDLRYIITPGTEEVAEVAFRYGAFIQSIIDFVIIALAIFLVIRAIQSRKQPEAPPAPPIPRDEVVLLAEIRDLLKEQ